jgi:fructose 1,6-bisphosphatase
MTPAELVERVAQGIATTQDDDWNNPALFMADANDTAESGREAYRDMAHAAIAIALEEAAKVAEERVAYSTGQAVIRDSIAAAIRAMIPNGNDPAQDDDADSK